MAHTHSASIGTSHMTVVLDTRNTGVSRQISAAQSGFPHIRVASRYVPSTAATAGSRKNA